MSFVRTTLFSVYKRFLNFGLIALEPLSSIVYCLTQHFGWISILHSRVYLISVSVRILRFRTLFVSETLVNTFQSLFITSAFFVSFGLFWCLLIVNRGFDRLFTYFAGLTQSWLMIALFSWCLSRSCCQMWSLGNPLNSSTQLFDASRSVVTSMGSSAKEIFSSSLIRGTTSGWRSPCRGLTPCYSLCKELLCRPPSSQGLYHAPSQAVHL